MVVMGGFLEKGFVMCLRKFLLSSLIGAIALEADESGGIIAAIVLLILLFALLSYVITAWLLYRIGKKLGYKDSWLAWVPIGNVYMMVDLSKENTMPWFLAILITSLIPFINIASVVMLVIVWADIAERCGKERWWGILLLIPIVNWIVMYSMGSGPAVPPYPTTGTYPGQPGMPPNISQQPTYTPPPPPGAPQPPYTPPPPSTPPPQS